MRATRARNVLLTSRILKVTSENNARLCTRPRAANRNRLVAVTGRLRSPGTGRLVRYRRQEIMRIRNAVLMRRPVNEIRSVALGNGK